MAKHKKPETEAPAAATPAAESNASEAAPAIVPPAPVAEEPAASLAGIKIDEEKAAVAVAAVPASVAIPKYRVIKDRKFSFYGQVVIWKAGSEHELWSEPLQMAKDAGVELELVK